VTVCENLESEVVTYRDIHNPDTQCFPAVDIVEPCKQFNESDRALGDRAFSAHVAQWVMKEYACAFCVLHHKKDVTSRDI
jgi:hypothetical protein